uniref:Uncharacterized protein n=1 Tax=Caenorhabditis tropicalis TaxID=1561998 RepID=A0A1I7TE52_9PELO
MSANTNPREKDREKVEKNEMALDGAAASAYRDDRELMPRGEIRRSPLVSFSLFSRFNQHTPNGPVRLLKNQEHEEEEEEGVTQHTLFLSFLPSLMLLDTPFGRFSREGKLEYG